MLQSVVGECVGEDVGEVVGPSVGATYKKNMLVIIILSKIRAQVNLETAISY